MYYFIVNPYARRGRGEKIWKTLERQLQKSGVEYKVMMTREQGDACSLARQLTENCRDPRSIVAVGGDGTINEILNGLSLNCPVTLGYIPAGSGNDFARSLKLPKNPGRCLKKILNPKYYRNMDYGILSYGQGVPVYRRFAVSSGIGFDAAVCHELAELRNKTKRSRINLDRLSYILLGLKLLVFTAPVKGYLILDGVKKIEFNHIYFISFHIHPYEGGGFRFAPHADGGDGKLEVCVAHNASKRHLFSMLLDALIGRANHHRGVHFYSCNEVQVHVDRPMPVHVDGECCLHQPDIHLRCVEKKLRMMV